MRGARYPKLVAIRRMLGVAAFAYACAHLSLYVVDQHFALLPCRLRDRAALLSDDRLRRLARPRRADRDLDRRDDPAPRPALETLHSLVYGIAALALLHFMIQAKADVSEPVMMFGFFAILMLFRVLLKRGLPGLGRGARRSDRFRLR